MNWGLNSIPLLVGVSIATLAIVGLLVLLVYKIDTKSIGQILMIGVPLVVFGGATAVVQYRLYELRPDFFHDNGNAVLLYADIILGMFAAFGVIRVVSNDNS
jgi:membrane-bound ClpP family serine protease